MDFKLSHQKSTTFGIVHSRLMKLHVKVRSSHFFSCMAIRKDRHVVSPVGVQFEGNNDIGVFSKLTNKYCLVCTGGSENFYGAFETELADQIPVIHSSIAGCRFVGRVTAGRLYSRSFYVGNKNGLLVPLSTTDNELQQLRNSLPDGVVIRRIDERLSSLGNLIACNDHVALLHSDLDRVGSAVVSLSVGDGGDCVRCARCGGVQTMDCWKCSGW